MVVVTNTVVTVVIVGVDTSRVISVVTMNSGSTLVTVSVIVSTTDTVGVSKKVVVVTVLTVRVDPIVV